MQVYKCIYKRFGTKDLMQKNYFSEAERGAPDQRGRRRCAETCVRSAENQQTKSLRTLGRSIEKL